MKLLDVTRSALGACVVYVAMAACSNAPEGSAASAGGGLLDGLLQPVPAAAADPTSGSRLKVEYRVAEDGSRTVLSSVWFDVKRKEECSFGQASDGKQRCLPASTLSSYYADSACTQLVLALYSGPGCAGSPPHYAGSPDLSACQSGLATAIHEVAAAVSPPTLFFKASDSCVQISTVPGYLYYATGPEIPPSSFVAASIKVDP